MNIYMITYTVGMSNVTSYIVAENLNGMLDEFGTHNEGSIVSIEVVEKDIMIQENIKVTEENNPYKIKQ